MKKLFILMFMLTGCATGEGVFDGTLVDAEWSGIAFKSCELTFQLGQQSSTTSKGSSRDYTLCTELTGLVGSRITVSYTTYMQPCCVTTDTNYIINNILSRPLTFNDLLPQ